MYCFIDRTMSLCKTIILPRSVFVVFFYLLWICHLVTGKLDFIGFVVILIVLNVTFPKSYAPFSSFFFFLSLMTNYSSKTSVSEMLTFGQIPKGEVYSQRQFMFYQHRLCFFCDFCMNCTTQFNLRAKAQTVCVAYSSFINLFYHKILPFIVICITFNRKPMLPCQASYSQKLVLSECCWTGLFE